MAKKLVRQKEAVKGQCQQLQAGVSGSSKKDPILVDEIKGRGKVR